MIHTIRTNSDHPHFIEHVTFLDQELAVRDGEDHGFYAQFNKIDQIKHVVLAYENNQAMGCGAMKAYQPDVMEIKRMYTTPEGRGKGIATTVLNELEKWAAELSCKKCILETGINQPEAIGLYKKNGYNLISNYGQYAGVDNSLCFEKLLNTFID